MNPLIPQAFAWRGKKTLIIIFLFRLAPLAVAIAALFVLALFKDSLFASIVIQNPKLAEVLMKAFSFAVGASALVIFLSAILLTGLALLEYYSFAYMFDAHSFKTRTGIFHIIEVSIPYQQIQNVDLNRPLIYRIFGMSRIVLLTAGRDDNPSDGHDSNSAVVNLINKAQGEAIQHELLERSHKPANPSHTH